MAAGGMSSSTVAVLAGISPRFAFRLLYGRGGRPLKRIDPETAAKLLRVSPGEARAVRWRSVPAPTTVRHLRRLRAAGWCEADLARVLGLSQSHLGELLCSRRRSCTQLVALRAAAEVSLLQTPLPQEPARARAAA
jgi:hypothetical protein